eukprot:2543451-Pleurochrysis_carterae.AAC.1
MEVKKHVLARKAGVWGSCTAAERARARFASSCASSRCARALTRATRPRRTRCMRWRRDCAPWSLRPCCPCSPPDARSTTTRLQRRAYLHDECTPQSWTLFCHRSFARFACTSPASLISQSDIRGRFCHFPTRPSRLSLASPASTRKGTFHSLSVVRGATRLR